MGATCWRLSAGTAILVSMRATAYQRNLATKYRIPEQIGKRTNFNVSAKTGEEKSPYRLEVGYPRGRPRFPVPAARGRRKKDMELAGEFLLTPSCKIGRRKRSFFAALLRVFARSKGRFSLALRRNARRFLVVYGLSGSSRFSCPAKRDICSSVRCNSGKGAGQGARGTKW